LYFIIKRQNGETELKEEVFVEFTYKQTILMSKYFDDYRFNSARAKCTKGLNKELKSC